jgi:hypothetical protein
VSKSDTSSNVTKDSKQDDEVISDSGASIHVAINEKLFCGPCREFKPALKLQTANGVTSINRIGIWARGGSHDDPDSRPTSHLFSVPRAVKDGLKVEFKNCARTMVVTHADNKLSKFKLERGLYRTTVSKMHRDAEDFTDNSEEEVENLGVLTRAMSKSQVKREPDAVQSEAQVKVV